MQSYKEPLYSASENLFGVTKNTDLYDLIQNFMSKIRISIQKIYNCMNVYVDCRGVGWLVLLHLMRHSLTAFN